MTRSGKATPSRSRQKAVSGRRTGKRFFAMQRKDIAEEKSFGCCLSGRQSETSLHGTPFQAAAQRRESISGLQTLSRDDTNLAVARECSQRRASLSVASARRPAPPTQPE